MELLSDAQESTAQSVIVDQSDKQLVTVERTKIPKSATAQIPDNTQTSETAAENGRFTKRQKVETYLRQRFRFQVNELTGGVEYRLAGHTVFLELTDYRLNSICRQIDSELGLAVPPGTLLEYLKSDFVPAFHPIKEYFNSLDTQVGTPIIEQLAATVAVQKPEVFKLALTRWLVATVANVFGDGCQNQTCLVLTGDQGGYKTTWLNLLCPPALEKYRFCGKIDLQSKDTLILLATQFLINLDDQLKSLNRKDGDTVKTLITHGNVTIRRPYDKIASYLTRVASFCGSINGCDFLSDPTGSRRFLPFEVEQIAIDAAQKLDIDLVWAEANSLYKAGYQYWFTAKEISELFDNNEEFQVRAPEYELLHQYYEVVKQYSDATVRLTTTDLLTILQGCTRIQLSMGKLGSALKQSNTLKKTSRPEGNVKVWFLRQRTGMEIEARKSLDNDQ